MVTFLLFAYNQERYIESAVTAALNQDYEPLQIVISDDFSSDNTFAVITRLVRQYDGPHEIIVNRSPATLGVGGHLRSIIELIEGDIVVVAAGDDVSSSNRTTIIADCFGRDRQVMAVFSKWIPIDDTGAELNATIGSIGYRDLVSLAKRGGGVGPGAAYAYRKECLLWPYPYPPHINNEDRLLPFRAALLGKVAYCNEALVRLRVVPDSMSRRPGFVFARCNPDHRDELLRTVRAANDIGVLSWVAYSYLSRLISSTHGRDEILRRLGDSERILDDKLYNVLRCTFWRRNVMDLIVEYLK